ncbi:hypothetical protein CEXT_272621 [Caerostris extrusa]|uniref:Uncharacterized protein n=1 Tax=Caerostris extrusa TaxID=172846 RepID=A0AAV4SVK3_CAEEX|nr:hypothetical protein CEXT_272621 [Caerostris extrusa]
MTTEDALLPTESENKVTFYLVQRLFFVGFPLKPQSDIHLLLLVTTPNSIRQSSYDLATISDRNPLHMNMLSLNI